MKSVLSFENICYSVPAKGCKPCSKKRKQILFDVSGVFKPGLNAILGPTGSGKTTLLDILASRIDERGLEGEVKVDGKKQPKNFNAVSGYVVQDDLVMGTLTVQENITFSANLRLSNSLSTQEKGVRVQQVIEELGLSKVSQSKIGTELMRGVSGGERKRTSIAMELITSPSVLFLDEPTTGLDASTSISVMRTLKRLAEKGRTVIFSIHQPRFAIFNLFDSLLLLSAGRCIYHGNADLALAYFASIGHKCEEHNNPPDFFLDVITSREQEEFKREAEGGTLRKRKNAKHTDKHTDDHTDNHTDDHTDKHTDKHTDNHTDNHTDSHTESHTDNHTDDHTDNHTDNYADSHTDNHADNHVDEHMAIQIIDDNNNDEAVADVTMVLHQQFLQSPFHSQLKQQLQQLSSQQHTDAPPVHLNYAVNFPTQLYYVSKRSALNMVRNPVAIALQTVVSIITALIVGVMFLQVSDHVEESAIQNRQGAFFFVTVNQMFSSLSALEIFIKQKSIFIHENASGYYRVSAYFVAMVFCDVIPMRILPCVCFSIISYFMLGFQMYAHKFFIFLLGVLLTNLTGTALSLFFSSSFTVIALANLVTTLWYILMMLFGGFLVNLDTVVVWLRWIKYFSLIRYGFNILAINELQDLTLYTNKTADPKGGSKVLDSLKIAHDSPWDLWSNVVALLLIIIIVLFLTYLQLRRTPKHK